MSDAITFKQIIDDGSCANIKCQQCPFWDHEDVMCGAVSFDSMLTFDDAVIEAAKEQLISIVSAITDTP